MDIKQEKKIIVDSFDTFNSFIDGIINMGTTLAQEFGFSDKDEIEQNDIYAECREWFSYSANRAEYKDGSWHFIEGETYINRFPVRF